MRALRILALFSITVGPALWVATCGGDGATEPTPTPPPTPPPAPANRAPTAVGSVAAQTVTVGENVTVNVASNFSDPDGNTLSYSAASSDDAVATASTSGSSVTINGVAAGSATVTVTASDPGGLSATQSIAVTVEAANQAPMAVDTIPDQSLGADTETTVDVAAYFSDPDGDELTYAASSSDTTVATVSVSEATVTIMGVAPGSAVVTVTATDPGGLFAEQKFDVEVVVVTGTNTAPEVTDGIPAQTLSAGDTVRVNAAMHFADPDDDPLSYAASSADTAVATARVTGDDNATIEIAAKAAGETLVTVSARDPEGLMASQEVTVTVEAPAVVTIANTIPTHDMIVDSMVTLDVSPYFEEGDGLTYAATTSDEAVATVSVAGTSVTTTGVSAVEDSVSVAFLSVTATNAGGGMATQDSIKVRVHREEYDSLPGITVNEEGVLEASFGGSTIELTFCLQAKDYQIEGQTFTVFWSEWQRAVGGGWVVAQDNAEAHVTAIPGNGGSICPINIGEDDFPPGVYRLVGHVQVGEDVGHYKTPTFEKKPEA